MIILVILFFNIIVNNYKIIFIYKVINSLRFSMNEGIVTLKLFV